MPTPYQRRPEDEDEWEDIPLGSEEEWEDIPLDDKGPRVMQTDTDPTQDQAVMDGFADVALGPVNRGAIAFAGGVGKTARDMVKEGPLDGLKEFNNNVNETWDEYGEQMGANAADEPAGNAIGKVGGFMAGMAATGGGRALAALPKAVGAGYKAGKAAKGPAHVLPQSSALGEAVAPAASRAAYGVGRFVDKHPVIQGLVHTTGAALKYGAPAYVAGKAMGALGATGQGEGTPRGPSEAPGPTQGPQGAFAGGGPEAGGVEGAMDPDGQFTQEHAKFYGIKTEAKGVAARLEANAIRSLDDMAQSGKLGGDDLIRARGAVRFLAANMANPYYMKQALQKVVENPKAADKTTIAIAKGMWGPDEEDEQGGGGASGSY